MGTYTASIDGVAADFAADAFASPFEPKRFGWLRSQGEIDWLIWLGAEAWGL